LLYYPNGAYLLMELVRVYRRGVNGYKGRDASSGHHHPHELFVIDVSVSVNVSLADHLVYFLIGQLLSQVGHHVAKLSS
jgi:hypothetical protein